MMAPTTVPLSLKVLGAAIAVALLLSLHNVVASLGAFAGGSAAAAVSGSPASAAALTAALASSASLQNSIAARVTALQHDINEGLGVTTTIQRKLKTLDGKGGNSADIKALKQLHQSNLDAHAKLLKQVTSAQGALEASTTKHEQRYHELKQQIGIGGDGGGGGGGGAESTKNLAVVRESVAENKVSGWGGDAWRRVATCR